MIAAMAGREPTKIPEAIGAAMVPLSAYEQRVLMSVNELLTEAYEALSREHQGWMDVHKQMLSIIRRAHELDPAFKARGNAVTTGEAVEVLRRHGDVSLSKPRETLEETWPATPGSRRPN
jgi:hypothetical protein